MNKWKFDELVMATGNKGKLRELSARIAPATSKVKETKIGAETFGRR